MPFIFEQIQGGAECLLQRVWHLYKIRGTILPVLWHKVETKSTQEWFKQKGAKDMRCKRCLHVTRHHGRTNGVWWNELQMCPCCLTKSELKKYAIPEWLHKKSSNWCKKVNDPHKRGISGSQDHSSPNYTGEWSY